MKKSKSLMLYLQFALLFNSAFVKAAGVSTSESDLEFSTIGNASGYTLTKITDETTITDKDFVVTKYLGDASSGNLTPVKYLLTFKNPLGDDPSVGSPAVRYFKWSVDENGNRSLVNTGPYDAAKDITAYSSNNVRLDTTTNWADGSDINNSFLNRGTASVVLQGGAIYNAENKIINKINGDFIANFAEASEVTRDNVYGGAIYSGNDSIIRYIKGNFIGNYVKTTGDYAQGGAIYIGTGSSVDEIYGNFISNYAYSSARSNYGYGGAIHFAIDIITSKADKIVGDFIDNWSSNNGGAIYGGEINFLNGDFVGNHSGGYGGAISNGKYGILVGDFINNYSDCNAGAIYATQVDYIYGDFIGNHAVGAPGTFGGFGGGAISEVTGTIYGNFVGNYLAHGYGGAIHTHALGGELNIFGNLINNRVGEGNISRITAISGGAVYFRGGILNITGDLIGNYVMIHEGITFNRRMPGNSYGGAVYISGDSMSEVTVNGNFIGNNVSLIRNEMPRYLHGGAVSIGTSGRVTLNSNFVNNYLKVISSTLSSIASGGAIYNSSGANVNISLNNSSFTNNYIDVQNDYLDATITAQGGAIYASGSTTNFNVSEGKKIRNYGNYVEVNGAKDDANGGFLYMANSSMINFNTEKNSSYIIGDSRTGYDSIASDNTNNIINKNGKGEVIVNSSMEFYIGTLNVNEGNMTVNNKLGASAVRIASGASLSAKVNGNGSTFTNAALNYSNDGTLNLLAGETLASGNYDVFVFENPETVYFGNVKSYGGTFDHATGTFIVENALNLTIGETNPVNVQSNGRILAVGPETEDTSIVMNFNSAADVTVNSVFDTSASDDGFAEIVGAVNQEDLLFAESFAFDVENLGSEDTVSLSFFIGGGYDISQFTVYHKDAELGWELADITNLEYDGEYLSFIVDGFSSYGYVAAVPEPSRYAAILGFLAITFAIWRRRI